MKLAFSTRYVSRLSFEDCLRIAEDSRVGDIIPFDVFSEEAEPLLRSVRRRRLMKAKSRIAAVGFGGDFVSAPLSGVMAALRAAVDYSSPYLLLHTDIGDESAVKERLRALLSVKCERKIAFLLISDGTYSDSVKLYTLLSSFADSRLGAAWDVRGTCLLGGESPSDTASRLGAFIRYVALSDGKRGDASAHELTGEGDLPLAEVVAALRTLAYAGDLALDFSPDWLPGLSDMSAIVTHYESVMTRKLGYTANEQSAFPNRTRTGYYVFPKDSFLKETLFGALQKVAERFPDQTAFSFATAADNCSYNVFCEEAERMARAFVTLGIGRGSRIALWLPNDLVFFKALFAAAMIGAITVPLPTLMKAEEAVSCLRATDAELLITANGFGDVSYVSALAAAFPELGKNDADMPLHNPALPFLRHIMTVGFRKKGCYAYGDIDDLTDATPEDEVRRMAVAVSPEDVLLMVPTYRFDGDVCAVMLSGGALLNAGKSAGDRCDLSTADRVMLAAPAYDVLSLSGTVIAALTHGATLCPLPYFAPKAALSLIAYERITVFPGYAPTFLSVMAHPDFPLTDLSSLRAGILINPPFDGKAWDRIFSEMPIPELCTAYGEKETAGILFMSDIAGNEESRKSGARPVAGNACRLGEDGKLFVRAMAPFCGYYRNAEKTARVLSDGVYESTFYAVCDEDGDRLMKTDGSRVTHGYDEPATAVLRKCIEAHPSVKTVTVTPVPDAVYGYELTAAVTVKKENPPTEEELIRYTVKRLSRFSVPKKIAVTEE